MLRKYLRPLRIGKTTKIHWSETATYDQSRQMATLLLREKNPKQDGADIFSELEAGESSYPAGALYTQHLDSYGASDTFLWRHSYHLSKWNIR